MYLFDLGVGIGMGDSYGTKGQREVENADICEEFDVASEFTCCAGFYHGTCVEELWRGIGLALLLHERFRRRRGERYKTYSISK